MKILFLQLLLLIGISLKAQFSYTSRQIAFNETLKSEIVKDSTKIRDSVKYYSQLLDPEKLEFVYHNLDSVHTRFFLSTFSRSKKKRSEVKFDTTFLGAHMYIRTIPDNPSLRFIVNADSVYFFRKSNQDLAQLGRRYNYFIDLIKILNNWQDVYNTSTAMYLYELGFLRNVFFSAFIADKEAEDGELSKAYLLQYKFASKKAQLIHPRHPFDNGGNGPGEYQAASLQDFNDMQSQALKELQEAKEELKKAKKEYNDNPTALNKERMDKAYQRSREKTSNYYRGGLPGVDFPSAMGGDN